MATGEDFMRLHAQRSEASKPKLIVNKKEEQRINAEIRKLQNEDSELYNDDFLSDEDLRIKSAEYRIKIHQLIDSMYESKEQVKNRLKR